MSPLIFTKLIVCERFDVMLKRVLVYAINFHQTAVIKGFIVCYRKRNLENNDLLNLTLPGVFGLAVFNLQNKFDTFD